MSVTLHPGRYFTVVRQIANHLDTDTNYVRAVIRNAYTDAVIDTLDLTDKGGQRFKKDWKIPADPSGQGFYVSIVTSVYTDSGYTTKNANYGDEENTYLIIDRRAGGGGGVGGVDSFTVRRILQEELDKRTPEPVQIPEIPPMRFDEVLGAIQEVKRAVTSLPEPQEPDLAPVLSAIASAKAAIEQKETTPETDLAPVLAGLEALHTAVTDAADKIVGAVGQSANAFKEAIPPAISDAFATVDLTPRFNIDVKPQGDKKAPSIDITQLSK